MASSVRHPPPAHVDEQPPHGRRGSGAGSEGSDTPPQGGSDGRGSPQAEAPEVKKLSPTGLAVSGAAAATSSVIGGQLGAVGTVVGAFLTAIVSALALALYTDSVNKSKEKLKTVAVKAQTKSSLAGMKDKSRSRTAPQSASAAPGSETTGASTASADHAGTEGQADGNPSGQPSRGRRIVKVVLLAVMIALIGFVAVFGIQRLTGVELSPGTGEIQRSVSGSDAVAPRENSTSDDPQQEDGRSPAPDDLGETTEPEGDGGTAPQLGEPSESEPTESEPTESEPTESEPTEGEGDAPSEQSDAPAQ